MMVTMMIYHLWSRRGGAMTEPVGLSNVDGRKLQHMKANIRRMLLEKDI